MGLQKATKVLEYVLRAWRKHLNDVATTALGAKDYSI